MYPHLNPEDIQKVKSLIDTRQRNNRFSWMISDYLNQNQCSITKELMESIDPDGAMPEEIAFTALLSGFCGLDTENSEQDKELSNAYFRPAIKKLKPESYMENPFYRDILIPDARLGDWELEQETYQPYEAFIYNDIVLEADFREIPQIGFFSEAFRFPAVLENDHEWMAIKPNEIETMQPAIHAMEGNVVTFGLGLGYFAYMVSLKESVQSITVVECNREVIRLFENHILPQFQYGAKINIISSDAFQFVEKQMIQENFDFAFVDLWHDVSDGLALYLSMKKLEHFNPQTKFLYWIEDSLLSALRWQLFDRIIQNSRSYEEIVHCLSNPFLKQYAAASSLSNQQV